MTRQVLVIEDDEDIAKLVKLQLTELSCSVTLVNEGTKGLAEAQSKRYDLIVLDLMSGSRRTSTRKLSGSSPSRSSSCSKATFSCVSSL